MPSVAWASTFWYPPIMQEAMGLGITGTPAFVINGHVVPGALPFELFEQAIEGLIVEASAPSAGN